MCACPRDFIRCCCTYGSIQKHTCMCVFCFLFFKVQTLSVQTKLLCLHMCGLVCACLCENLLLMLGRYNGIGVQLRARIAPLLTEQSTSCPLCKQTGYSDQYGYQTRPPVACVCLNRCVKERESVREKRSKVWSLGVV